MNPTRHPLAWPVGWVRTRPGARQRARFNDRGHEVSIAVALDRLFPELERLGAVDVVVSSNVPVRVDGLPYSNMREPDDPGVAVYFRPGGGAPTVLACDRWDRAADNVTAIALHVGAMRGMDRWGVGTRAQAFAGYAALPAVRAWWEVLEFKIAPAGPDALERVRSRVRELAGRYHPDRPGGDAARMAEVNEAAAAAAKELGRS